jgi:hypothetical protein
MLRPTLLGEWVEGGVVALVMGVERKRDDEVVRWSGVCF